MKIDLQEPFKSKWDNGYLVVNSEDRKNVCLVNSNSDRTTISYARYLMSVSLGYIIPRHLEVDHKDNDKTNDDPNNLQLLTKLENKIKQENYFREHVQEHHGFYCPECGIPFLLEKRQAYKYINAGTSPCCSRMCARKRNLNDGRVAQ